MIRFRIFGFAFTLLHITRIFLLPPFVPEGRMMSRTRMSFFIDGACAPFSNLRNAGIRKRQLQSGEARTREACYFDSCRAVFQFSFPQLFKGFDGRQNVTNTAPEAPCCSDRSLLWNCSPTSPQDGAWKSFPARGRAPFRGSASPPSICCGSVSARVPCP